MKLAVQTAGPGATHVREPIPATIRAATYGRVSSERQKENETIKTQDAVIDAFLQQHPEYVVVQHYRDAGVSGSIPLNQRPDGCQLVRDALAGRFDVLILTRPDRLGRDVVDLYQSRALFKGLGIQIIGVLEPVTDDLMFGIRAVVAEDEKRRLLARSAEGTARAASEGKYTGGIVPLGYRVSGVKAKARLVPSDVIMWGTLSEADVVRRIFHHLAADRWSCRRIADDLNRLGIPTAYQREGPGFRHKKTQGVWRAGRIRNLVTNAVYKGELQYGRRSKQPRAVISACIEPLVSEAVWAAAQQTLADYRMIPPAAERRVSLLRGALVCALCGLHYCATTNRADTYYRCDGQLVARGPLRGRCPGKSIPAKRIEPLIWDDIERFLRDPGPLLEELQEEAGSDDARGRIAAELTNLRKALAEVERQRERVLDAFYRGHTTAQELDAKMQVLAAQRAEIDGKIAVLSEADEPDEVPPDLLVELQQRLDEGLTDAQRNEIVRLLVRRIVVHTEVDERGKKHASLVAEYRFGAVGLSHTDTGSLPRSARNLRETSQSPVRG
jgi:site-specific DNA recombinase